MGIINELVRDIPLPKMVKVRQKFDRPRVEDIEAEVYAQLSQPKIKSAIKPGMSIAITAGSRGVANVALITREIANFVKSCGAHPFIVPAMGSHGGATAEGQRQVLISYGVTEEFCGCPIKSSMETVKIGTTEENHNVLIDKNAAEADGIIVSCRIKPHTGFRGRYESGVMKMMTIGLGKREGADVCHKTGFHHMAKLVPMFGNVIRKNAKVLFAIAALENAYDETAKIVAMTNDEIPDLEPVLLEEAKRNMAQILIPECDVLIIDKIGKNFSGPGADPNVTGMWITSDITGGFKSQRKVVLDLSDETHGCSTGLGLVDFSTRRVFNKLDMEKTYANCITATVTVTGKIPIIAESDRDAIKAAVKLCYDIEYKDAKIIRIANSLHIDEIYISEPLVEQAKAHPNMEIISEPMEFPFDECGNLW